MANCHKLSEKTFERRRLSVDEIVEEWDDLIMLLKHFNPNLKIIFTVSPIRHIKDTLHGNQLSKSVLLLAIDEIIKRYQDFTEYFPSYEILMDELRDYRFYAEDMVHPSQTAISYIREKFSGCYFTEETKRDINFCSKINMALSHRPSDPGSAAYKNFLEQNIKQIKNYIEKNNIPQLESAIEGFDKKLRKL